MLRAKELTIERLLQRAADHLWAGLPDRMHVSLTNQQIRYHYVGWSAALFRHRVENDVGLSDARGWLRPISTGDDWEEIAPRIMRVLLNMAAAHQRAFHATATALGLVKHGVCSDLPGDRISIDALLRNILSQSGMNMGNIISSLTAEKTRELIVHDQDEMILAWPDQTFFVRHRDRRLPLLSTWVSIGRGEFNGTIIELPDILPEVIVTTAPGRRLGEFVSTGLPELDRRTIRSAVVYDKQAQKGGWHAKSNTEFTVEPDLVHIGE